MNPTQTPAARPDRQGHRHLALLALLLWLQVGGAAAQEVLRPEKAFPYSARVEGSEVIVRWDITPGYYLYRERMAYTSATPGVVLGEPQLPAGIPHEDEFFGPMEIYRGVTEIRLPLDARPATGGPAQIGLRVQGCADIGLCYPPQDWVARVDLPATPTAPADTFGRLMGRRAGGGDAPLPAEAAFRWRAEAVDPFTVEVEWTIATGYYLYRHTLEAAIDDPAVRAGTPILPAGTPKWDEEYGDTLVHYDTVTLTLPLQRAGPEARTVTLDVAFQGCKDGSICYPPQRVSTPLQLPAATSGTSAFDGPAPQSEQDRLMSVIVDGHLAAVMALFAGLGLLLSFTPCCLPMYPILSGVIVGQGGNVSDMRAFLLALAYVLGMALTYTVLGIVVAAAGAQVQALFQQPWVIITVALVFVAMALSMFGLYALQLPSAWQTRLAMISGRQHTGGVAGAALMGVISAAIVTTCVTPPLVAALTLIARSGDMVRGGAALFALAIGMGLPLLAIGASAGRLMPRAGPWMNTVKTLFGLMMLGLAAWMLDRLWPAALTLAAWGLLLVAAGVFLGAFTRLGQEAGTGHKLGKAAGLAACLYGAALLVGALAGNDDPLRPLQFRGDTPAGISATRHPEQFTPIKTLADLERELTAARAAGKALMLDFYADWCTSCKQMERDTFQAAEVRAALANMVLLQADVTAVDVDDQALMRRFGIIGPPTIVFFDASGQENEAWRIVGFTPPARFAAHVTAILGGQ